MTSTSIGPIPVSRPLLPTAAELLPYLERIDAARTYSNFGPLSNEFAGLLGEALGIPPAAVLPAGSATAALMAAILAAVPYPAETRRLAVIPSFTFAATAAAVERCGLAPCLADVDPESWALTPAAVLALPCLAEVAIVIPVAPFGRPMDPGPWLEFRASTGIPVVLDAAAGFTALSLAPPADLAALPTVLSFHATKGFGIGEGGCLLTSDPALMERATGAINFGFNGSRESRYPSFNGKLSEIHAAVGLATFRQWPVRRERIALIGNSYRRAFTDAAIPGELFAFPEVDAGCTLWLAPDSACCDAARQRLDDAGIAWRMWYASGIESQPWFANSVKAPLPVSRDIAGRLLGLPMFPDISSAEIARVAAAVGGHD